MIGTNLLLAALAMIPFTVASELLNRTLEENEGLLQRLLRPARWLGRFFRRRGESSGRFPGRLGTLDTVKLVLIVLLYGLIFSLLERDWNPFSLTGVYLFVSMTVAFGIAGIADDIAQWRAARRWGVATRLNLRPANLLLAIFSTAFSRLFRFVPGVMFGTPEAFEIDRTALDQRKTRRLLFIATGTAVVIGLGVWLLTGLTALVQRAELPRLLSVPVAGLESLLLLVFAAAMQNAFVQMLALPGSTGRALLRWNRWVWGAGLLAITFLFYHALVNPRGNLATALKSTNVRAFLITVGVFVIAAVGVWLGLRLRRRAAHVAVPSALEPGAPAISPPAETVSVSAVEGPPAPPVMETAAIPEVEGGAAPPALEAEPIAAAEAPAGPPPTEAPSLPEVGEPAAPPPAAAVPAAGPSLSAVEPRARVDALIWGMKAPDPAARERSLQQMVALGPLAVPPLIACLRYPDRWARFMAAVALGRMGDARAAESLRGALSDPDEGVRHAAQMSLKALPQEVPAVAGPSQPVAKVPSAAGPAELAAVAGETKQCPQCGQSIPAEARACSQCGARFLVQVNGYCLNCHAVVLVGEDGKCQRCRGDVVDRRVRSWLEGPAARPAARPAVAAAPLPPPPAQAAVVPPQVRPAPLPVTPAAAAAAHPPPLVPVPARRKSYVWLWAIVAVLVAGLAVGAALWFGREQISQLLGPAAPLEPTPPTPAATPNMPSRWPLVLFDMFDRYGNAGWRVGMFDSESCVEDIAITMGTYHWEVKALRDFASWSIPQVKAVSDFYLAVGAKQISGPDDGRYGVVFRFVDDQNFYYFRIDSLQQLHLDILYQGIWISLIQATTSPVIRSWGVNRLTVVGQGSHFDLFVNDQFVAHVDDSRLPQGKVGLGVGLQQAGAEAAFEFENFEFRSP